MAAYCGPLHTLESDWQRDPVLEASFSSNITWLCHFMVCGNWAKSENCVHISLIHDRPTWEMKSLRCGKAICGILSYNSTHLSKKTPCYAGHIINKYDVFSPVSSLLSKQAAGFTRRDVYGAMVDPVILVGLTYLPRFTWSLTHWHSLIMMTNICNPEQIFKSFAYQLCLRWIFCWSGNQKWLILIVFYWDSHLLSANSKEMMCLL